MGDADRAVTAAFMPQFGFEPWCGVGVERWLSLFCCAACVFTNSFHGMVFSLLFGHPLHVARLTGELSLRNGRIEELLRRTGMEGAFDGVCPVPENAVMTALRKDKETSMAYLRRIVGDGAL